MTADIRKVKKDNFTRVRHNNLPINPKKTGDFLEKYQFFVYIIYLRCVMMFFCLDL